MIEYGDIMIKKTPHTDKFNVVKNQGSRFSKF